MAWNTYAQAATDAGLKPGSHQWWEYIRNSMSSQGK